jgi:hypothetical protein
MSNKEPIPIPKSWRKRYGMRRVVGVRAERLKGTDVDGRVYQTGLSRHSPAENFRAGYDGIEWDED